MTTIRYVQRCAPWSMVDYGNELDERAEDFVAQVYRMDRAVRELSGNWRGASAAAASARTLGERISATAIDETVRAMIVVFLDFGTRLDSTRTTLLDKVADATTAGMTVADDGTVTAPPYPYPNTMASTIMQAQLDDRARHFQTGIAELLKKFGEDEQRAAELLRQGIGFLVTLAKAPTAPMLTADRPAGLGQDTIFGSRHHAFGDWYESVYRGIESGWARAGMGDGLAIGGMSPSKSFEPPQFPAGAGGFAPAGGGGTSAPHPPGGSGGPAFSPGGGSAPYPPDGSGGPAVSPSGDGPMNSDGYARGGDGDGESAR